MSGLQIGNSEIVADVIAQIARMNFGVAQGIDSFGVVFVKNMRVAEHQPRQGAGIFFGMGAGVGLYTGVSRGRVRSCKKLLRHGAQTGGGHEGLPHARTRGETVRCLRALA